LHGKSFENREVFYQFLLFFYLAAQPLLTTLSLLRVQSSVDRAFGWFGRYTLFLRDRHALDELHQTVQSFISVLLLTSVLLGLDDDDTLFGDALVFE